jgi:hypothetical protein
LVPAQFAPMISRAAQRWSVSAALLAAQLYGQSLARSRTYVRIERVACLEQPPHQDRARSCT